MTMNLERFESLLDTHGADPERWPDQARDAAMGLLAQSSDAQAALAAAQRLDAMLVSGLAEHASANLHYRISAAATLTRTAQPDRAGWFSFLAEPWRIGAATAAAASIALGMVVGLQTSVATVLDEETAPTMELAALAYGELDGIEDIQ